MATGLLLFLLLITYLHPERCIICFITLVSVCNGAPYSCKLTFMIRVGHSAEYYDSDKDQDLRHTLYLSNVT